MTWKTVFAGLLLTLFISISATSFIYAQGSNPDFGSPNLWDSAIKSLIPNFSLENGIVDISSPEGYQLTVRGRKTIGINYTRFNYFDPEAAEDKPTSSTEIKQEFQLRARGKIGDKISVNVDYDDTLPRTEQQKINLIYTGYEDEIIQEIALGDIQLALPKTHFTSYKKNLFGARIRAKWGDFYLTGIGSVTRGVSETKEFTGKTSTQEKEIPDTGYIKRKYFKVFFDQDYPPGEGGFSYTSGSVEVWIDDQDGTNNISGETVHMTVIGEPVDSTTDTYTGYFDRQYPGQDYTVNPSEGVIKFNKSIGESYVIALSYRDADGTRHPAGQDYYMIMRGPDEKYFKYRLQNYYYLGSQKIRQEDFVFQIKDLSGKVVYDWDNPEAYPAYEVEVDFDFGIVQIFNPQSTEDYYNPFPEAYPPSSLHRYTLYTKYVHAIGVYLLHPDMIPGSEEVYVDGKLLKKGEDYTIDYSSGYLSFLDPELIGPDTKIRVEYEWAPIMGGQATFLGGRLEYRPWENFSIGSTYLSQAASPVGEIPSLGSSPAAHRVLETDLTLNFQPNLGSLWGKDFPVNLLLSGEVSSSNVNPNTFGSSMLENFSTSKVEETLTLNKEKWMLGSIPPDTLAEERDEVIISDQEIPGEEVDPLWSDDEIKVLTLTCDLTSGANWDSVVHSLSRTGKDFSHMKYLEVWARGISGVSVYVDLGVVSEDADGDGELDTEDENGDGILNPGEDTGILIGDRIIGKGNDRLDTEDLDGDGVLDTEENFSTYSLSGEYAQEIPGSNWEKYTIPLDTDLNWDSVKGLVKHARIWMEDSSFSGTVKFARIGISGDRWEIKGVEIKGVNNYQDVYPDFPDPFESSQFRSYYERMFGDMKTSEGKFKKESFLRITPTLESGSGYIQQTFLSTKNFSDYRQINFWIYQESGEGDFYVKFGSDVETDYYSYTLPLSSVSTERWVRIEVPFSDSNLESVGDPTFHKINQIRLGLTGQSPSTPFYINDIYLSRVHAREGQAQRYLVKGKFSDYFTLSTEYERIDPPFSVIGGTSTDETLRLRKWGLSSSFFDFLPFSYSRSEQYTSTLTTRGTDLTPVEKDKVRKETQNYQVGFRLSSWPTLSFKGQNISSDYLSEDPERVGFEHTYDLSLNYPVPISYPLLPSRISTSFQLKKSGERVEDVSSSKDITRSGNIKLPFRPLPNLVLKTSYAQSETRHFEDEGEGTPKARSKALSLESRFSLFGLTPQVSFTGENKEESFSSQDPDERKISTDFNTSFSFPLRPASFMSLPDAFSTLGWYINFGLKKEGIYENTSASIDDFSSQFGLTRLHLPEGKEKLWLERKTFNLKQSWKPLSYLSTSLSYGKEEEDKVEYGTLYESRTQNWPVAEFRFNLLDTPLVGPLAGRFLSSSSFALEYSRKRMVKEEISTTNTIQPSVHWRGRFKNVKDLSFTYSYTSNTKRERAYGARSSSEEFSSTHKLKLDWSGYIPWGRKIPLLSRIINFENRVNLSSTLTRELKYKETSAHRVEQDQEKWTLGTDIAYRISDNVNMKLGLNFAYYEDRVQVGEDYFSYGGSTWVEITF